jgi:hypothetical protein
VVHLAEDRHCQQSPGRETFDDRLIETSVPEQVTDNDIDWRPTGEADVEIDDIKPTAIVIGPGASGDDPNV